MSIADELTMTAPAGILPKYCSEKDWDRYVALVKITDSGCWRMGTSKVRYPRFYWNGKSWPSNRFVYTAIHGEIPPRMEVCHTCDNDKCSNPNHLFLGTHKENMQDCSRKGRTWLQRQPERIPEIVAVLLRIGEAVNTAKITEKDVLEIRRRRARGETLTAISEDFPIDRSMCGYIANRKAWKHIQEEQNAA